MSYEELVESRKNIGDMTKEELFTYCDGLLNEVWGYEKENEKLVEELKELNGIIEIGRKREYHSKFLKDFQKERGKNVFPDHDEIYKRYDDYKSKVEKAIDLYENDDYSTLADDMYKILKGVDKE